MYNLVAKHLNMSSDQHTEQNFKTILKGIKSVVNGLSSLRNKFGDAHGTSAIKNYKPKARHAKLVVNLSGSLSIFLYETFQEKTSNS